MFVSIEVTDFENFNLSKKVTKYEVSEYETNEKLAINDLKKYLISGGNTLDGDKIVKKLFPENTVDIFLSHSHDDKENVIKLAILLENRGFKVFIDSIVWGNAFELLRKIDDEYSKSDDDHNLYSYQKRNYSTAHIYMMLNTALHNMINKSEIFLFLGTPKSISIKEGIQNKKFIKSPWIYSELTYTKSVRRRSCLQVKKLAEDHKLKFESEESLENLSIHREMPELDKKIEWQILENILKQNKTNNIEAIKELYKNLKIKL